MSIEIIDELESMLLKDSKLKARKAWNKNSMTFQNKGKNFESIVKSIEHEKTYEEKYLRTRLFEIGNYLLIFLIGTDLALDPSISGSHLSDISQIGQFIGQKTINLNESWIIANCYLTAIDVL